MILALLFGCMSFVFCVCYVGRLTHIFVLLAFCYCSVVLLLNVFDMIGVCR